MGEQSLNVARGDDAGILREEVVCGLVEDLYGRDVLGERGC